MREATALHRRASFRLDGFAEPVVVGFKRTGAMSIYFDQDPVYQFDIEGRLRRAYRAELLYRTQGTTLAELRRERTVDQTRLLRRDLPAEELSRFQQEMSEHLNQAEAAFVTDFELIEVQPPDADLRDEILTGIRAALNHSTVLAPAIATRRK